jgi:hypothetical protein
MNLNFSKSVNSLKVGFCVAVSYWLPLLFLVVGLCFLKHLFFPSTVSAIPATTAAVSASTPGTAVSKSSAQPKDPAPSFSFAAINVLLGQQPPAPLLKESTSDEALQAFEKQITDECSAHRDFLEKMDAKLEDDAKFLGGAAILIFGAVLAFLGMRDRSGVKAYFQENVDAELKKKLYAFGKQSESEREKAISEVKDQIFSRLTREGEIETAVSQSLVTLGLYDVGKNAVGVAPWNKQLEPLLNDVLNRLKDLQQSNPESRLLAIQISRFADEYKGDLQAAIDCLKNTLQVRANANLPATPRCKIDDSALFYNWACYSNRLSIAQKAAGKTAESDNLKRDAQYAINKALELVPSDADDAKNEPELAGLAVP